MNAPRKRCASLPPSGADAAPDSRNLAPRVERLTVSRRDPARAKDDGSERERHAFVGSELPRKSPDGR